MSCIFLVYVKSWELGIRLGKNLDRIEAVKRLAAEIYFYVVNSMSGFLEKQSDNCCND